MTEAVIAGVAVLLTCLGFMGRTAYVGGRETAKVIAIGDDIRELRDDVRGLRASVSGVHSRVDETFAALSADLTETRERLSRVEGRLNGGK